MESYIELKEIRIHAYHGVCKQERRVGNDYIVRIKVNLIYQKPPKATQLATL